MKIALTTSGTDMDAPLDSRFGRAARFLIYDTETETYSTRKNEQGRNEAKGAGIRLAVQMVDEDVDLVISNHLGPIAYETLTAGGIGVYTCEAETIREAIDKLISGELIEAEGANVKAHWVEQ